MPNWKRIEKLTEHLATLPAKQFDMGMYIEVNPEIRTIGQAAKHCGTVCCIGGDAILLFAKKGELVYCPKETSHSRATRLLDLSDSEAGHVFSGAWDRKFQFTKARALRYLRKALKARDVMVTI